MKFTNYIPMKKLNRGALNSLAFRATDLRLHPTETSLPDLKTGKAYERGFSLLELLIVISVLMILAAVAIINFAATKKYAADDQAMKMLDIMQEARQKALTQKVIMRVEINNTKKQVRLFDENLPSTTNDDQLIRTVPFDLVNLVTGNRPPNVGSIVPTSTTSAIPEMTFKTTTYPQSNGNSVFTLCFLNNGRVVAPGTDNLCSASGVPGGATIYVSEKPNNENNSKVIRAVTVSSISGYADIAKCQLDSKDKCVKWVK